MIDPVSTQQSQPNLPQGTRPPVPTESTFASELARQSGANGPTGSGAAPPLPPRLPALPLPVPPVTGVVPPQVGDNEEAGENTRPSNPVLGSEETRNPAPVDTDEADTDARGTADTDADEADDGADTDARGTAATDTDEANTDAEGTANAAGENSEGTVSSRLDSLSPEMKKLVVEIVAEIFRRLGFRAPPEPNSAQPTSEIPEVQEEPRRIQETQTQRAKRMLEDQERKIIENGYAEARRLNAELRDSRSEWKRNIALANRGR